MCPDYRTFSRPALKALFDAAARAGAFQLEMQQAIKRELDRRAARPKPPSAPRR